VDGNGSKRSGKTFAPCHAQAARRCGGAGLAPVRGPPQPGGSIYSADELRAAADGFDGLLISPVDKMTAQAIERLPASVRIIATFSVGYDHIDVPAAKGRGLAVTNTPDVLTDATADIAMLLLLGAARGASWGERMVREDTWKAFRSSIRWATTFPGSGSASSAWAASARPWPSGRGPST
jgi:phosphoglycerate dehydrogenase-like enzyme